MANTKKKKTSTKEKHMEKKIGHVSYRLPEDIDAFLSEKSSDMLKPQKVITFLLRYVLKTHSDAEIDQILVKFITGKEDVFASTPLRKTGT